MRLFTSRLGFAALALVAAPGLVAQSVTTGSITGTVKDKNGASIAGAKVIATSTQVTREFTTGADGSFRFALLPPGEWSIRITKAGFLALTQKVTVTTNSTVPVAAKLALESQATVEVVAAVGTVDATATQTGANLSFETLNAIPKGRDFNSVLTLSPGVTATGIGLAVSGASGIENSFVLDGLDTTDYRMGSQAASLPSDFVDQVEVQTGGFRPEFNALGGVIVAVTKSGTNEFQGSAWATADAHQLQAKTKDNLYYREGAPRTRFDVGFTAGGALLPSKLFYFVGLNTIQSESNKSSIQPNNNYLSSEADKSATYNLYTKLNYFATTDQQITLALNYVNFKNDAPVLRPTTGDANLGGYAKSKTITATLNYDWNITSSLLLNAKIGHNRLRDTFDPVDSLQEAVTDRLYLRYATAGLATVTKPGVPRSTAFRRGGRGVWEAWNENTTDQAKVDLSWFAGNHSMKFGLSYVATKFGLEDKVSGGVDYTTSIYHLGGGVPAIYQTIYKNGATVKAIYTSLYAQDQWEIIPGLRLAYGFRWDSQELKGVRQTFLKFSGFTDNLQPRIGITWDVNKDGRTKLSANYALYQERVPLQPAMRTSGNETYIEAGWESGTNATYNADGSYTLIGAPDYIANYSGYFNDYPQPIGGLKVPKRTEWMLGADHTMDSGWTVGLHAKYRSIKDVIEDTVPTDAAGNYVDGEGFAILWNPQPGVIQWYNNQFHSTPGALNTWDSTGIFPEPQNIYQAVDLTLDKKAANYVISFNYTWSRTFGNYEGVGATSNGQDDANITALWDYYAYVGSGPLPLDRTHVAKVYGSYTFDLGVGQLTLGGKFTGMSGTPISRFTNANDIGHYGNATPHQGLYGQFGRTDTTMVTDFHVEWSQKLGKKMKLTPSIDVFNLFNVRNATGVDQFYTARGSAGYSGQLNPAYGYQNGWLTGRNLRWGVKLSF